MTWLLFWLAASGIFAAGYCVGAVIGFNKGARSAQRIANENLPFWESHR